MNNLVDLLLLYFYVLEKNDMINIIQSNLFKVCIMKPECSAIKENWFCVSFVISLFTSK